MSSMKLSAGDIVGVRQRTGGEGVGEGVSFISRKSEIRHDAEAHPHMDKARVVEMARVKLPLRIENIKSPEKCRSSTK